jgi:hypothetical protein
MQMPFGIRQHVEQIRAYAAMVAAEAHGSQAKDLVTLLHWSADDLEATARVIFNALGSNPAHLSRPVLISKTIWPASRA